MNEQERATIARAIVILNGAHATLNTLHALGLLDSLLPLPGTPERREAFAAAHAAQARVTH